MGNEGRFLPPKSMARWLFRMTKPAKKRRVLFGGWKNHLQATWLRGFVVAGPKKRKVRKIRKIWNCRACRGIRKSHKNQKSQVFLKAATWLAPLEAFAWVRVFRILEELWLVQFDNHPNFQLCVKGPDAPVKVTSARISFEKTKCFCHVSLEDIQPLKRTP